MKTAKYVVESVTLICPHCGEIIEHSSGSQFWTVAELDLSLRYVRCECGEKVRLPRVR